MSSNKFWSKQCFVVVVCMKHLSSIRLHSLRINLIFNFLGMPDWCCMKGGFLAVFFVKLEETFAVSGDGDFEIK